jgi:serine/threonine protein kinase
MANGVSKLADFGSAALVLDIKTQSRVSNVGTEAFTAPEILMSCKASPASDVWSLGATLLCLYTGSELAADPRVLRSPTLPWTIEDHVADTLSGYEGVGNKCKVVKIKGAGMTAAQRALWEGSTAEFRDFVTRCLQLDADDRLTTSALLDHEFVKTVSSRYSPRRPTPPLLWLPSPSTTTSLNDTSQQAESGAALTPLDVIAWIASDICMIIEAGTDAPRLFVKPSLLVVAADGVVSLAAAAALDECVHVLDAFAAPEIRFGSASTPAENVWSLGAMLLWLYTGSELAADPRVLRHPTLPWTLEDHVADTLDGFEGTGATCKVVKITGAGLTAAQRACWEGAPAEFRDFINRCLQLDVDKRSTADALRAHPFVAMAACRYSPRRATPQIPWPSRPFAVLDVQLVDPRFDPEVLRIIKGLRDENARLQSELDTASSTIRQPAKDADTAARLDIAAVAAVANLRTNALKLPHLPSLPFIPVYDPGGVVISATNKKIFEDTNGAIQAYVSARVQVAHDVCETISSFAAVDADHASSLFRANIAPAIIAFLQLHVSLPQVARFCFLALHHVSFFDPEYATGCLSSVAPFVSAMSDKTHIDDCARNFSLAMKSFTIGRAANAVSFASGDAARAAACIAAVPVLVTILQFQGTSVATCMEACRALHFIAFGGEACTKAVLAAVPSMSQVLKKFVANPDLCEAAGCALSQIARAGSASATACAVAIEPLVSALRTHAITEPAPRACEAAADALAGIARSCAKACFDADAVDALATVLDKVRADARACASASDALYQIAEGSPTSAHACNLASPGLRRALKTHAANEPVCVRVRSALQLIEDTCRRAEESSSGGGLS